MDEIIASYLADFNLFFLFLLFVILLIMIGKSADLLVDNAVDLSLNWDVSKMIIGATIVSIGTTLPEASVSVVAALSGNPDMALGNAIGSIICDTGLIIGIASLLGALPASGIIIERQGKIQLLAVLLLALVAVPFHQAGGGNISQFVGIMFLILLAIYVYYSIRWSKQDDKDYKDDEADVVTASKFSLLIKIAVGASGVIIASKILIPTVALIATKVGIPKGVIAATLVAFGTSLPELVTAINAVRKGHGELAVGNIIGADILNVLFVVGGAAAVSPQGLSVPSNFYFLQIPAMLIIVGAFRIFSKTDNQHITKPQGIFLAGIYFVYLLLNFKI